MVPELFVKILDMVMVQPKRVRETTVTEKPLILKLDTEDAMVETPASSNAEDMVDQTKMTRVLMLWSDAQEDHGYQNGKELVENSESPLKDTSTEEEETTYGDQ